MAATLVLGGVVAATMAARQASAGPTPAAAARRPYFGRAPAAPPATWREAVYVLAELLRRGRALGGWGV